MDTDYLTGVCEKRLQLRSPEFLADDDLAPGINAVDLKNVFGEIKADYDRMHCGWLPSCCLGNNFGTHNAGEWASSTPSPGVLFAKASAVQFRLMS